MQRWPTLFRSALSALTLAACSSGGDAGTTSPPVTPSIALQLSATAGTVSRGASGNATLSLSRGGGYAGTVALTAENVPTGVTATFTPASLAGTAASATVVFDVGPTATPGSSSITVRAAGSGVTAATAAYALSIPVPAVALTAGSGATSIVVGGSATVPITITRSNGFTDAIALAATGLPSGVTATFTPATIAAGSTTSTLSITVAGTATAGASTVTISASGTGVTTQTASLALTLTAATTPAVAVTATPAAVSIVAGASGTTAIVVSRTGGFAGDVTLALEGAPAGVTGAFSANPVLAAGTSSTLTLSTTGAAVPGIYNLTVRGTGTGVTAATTTVAVTVAAAPAITVAASPSAVTVAAGSAVTTAVTITRVGGYAADVSLAATGLPAGVTAGFAPGTLTGATLTSTLTLTSSTVAAVGAASVTVTATGTGVTARTATVGLTVTAAPTYTMAASAVSAPQGTAGASTITLTRGGGFAGTVNLAITGLPGGVTAAFNPTAVSGTTSTLTLTVGGAVPAGSYTGVITGTTAGLADVTANVSLTVTATSGGSGTVNWTFCEAERFPLWFAYQSGTGGAWTRVTSTGTTTRVYSFTTGSVGGVAYAQPNGNGTGTSVVVQYLSLSELTFGAANECVTNRATKSLTGTVAGLAAVGQQAGIGVGGSSATVIFPNTAFSITAADEGTTDLLAVRSALNLTTFSNVPDRGVLRRNVNYPAGSTIPVIDFTGGESFALASAQYTIANAGSDPVFFTTGFLTSNGTSGSFYFGTLGGAGTGPYTAYGIPNANTQAGDLHQVLAAASTGSGTVSSTRSVIQYNRLLANRTVTLGPVMSPPTVSSLGASPYLRFSTTGAWQAEYADVIGVGFTQQATSSNNWSINLTRAYAGSGATTWTLAFPDFSGVAGFNTSWAMTNATTSWSTSAAGFVSSSSTAPYVEDTSLRFGARTGTIAP